MLSLFFNESLIKRRSRRKVNRSPHDHLSKQYLYPFPRFLVCTGNACFSTVNGGLLTQANTYSFTQPSLVLLLFLLLISSACLRIRFHLISLQAWPLNKSTDRNTCNFQLAEHFFRILIKLNKLNKADVCMYICTVLINTSHKWQNKSFTMFVMNGIERELLTNLVNQLYRNLFIRTRFTFTIRIFC